MRIPRLALLVGIAALAGAVPAHAAPAQSGVVSAASPVYKWDGGPGNGTGNSSLPSYSLVRCQPVVYECEDTLIELKDPGTLNVEIKAGPGSNDLDLRFYESDASGTPPVPDDDGSPNDPSGRADARITARNLKPGFYIARVLFFNATQGTYTGTATLTGAPPAAPVPVVTKPAAAAPTPAAKPTAKKKISKRKACEKKAKKIKSKRKRAKALKRCKRIRG